MSDKENRSYYLRRGLCPHCGGKNPLMEGRTRCFECKRVHDEGQANRSKLWRETGRCTRCGRERDSDLKLCASCRAYMSDIRRDGAAKAKARRDELRAKGLCVQCGKTWAEPGHVCCKKCLDRHKISCKKEPYREKVKKRRQDRIDAGLCIDCGSPTENGKQRCPRCLEMRGDSSRKYRIIQKINKQADRARAGQTGRK